MFDKIVSRTLPQISTGLDVGTLAEVLLFYGETTLVLDYGTTVGLLKAIGEDNLFFLVDNGFVKVCYSMSQTGIQTDAVPGLSSHGFVSFQLGGMNPARPRADHQLALAYERALYKKTSKKFVTKILGATKVVGDLDELVGAGRPLSKLAMEKISDRAYVRSAASIMLEKLVPKFKAPNGLTFDAIPIGDRFIIDSNIDFRSINIAYHKVVSPKISTITQALMMSHIWSSVIDLNISATLNAELLTGDMYNSLIEARTNGLIKKSITNIQNIKIFSDFVFDDGRNIREAINSGQRNFDDFRPLLEKSRKFRQWLDEVEPNADILKEYHRACFSDTWVDRLPVKSARFASFASAGVVVDALAPTGLGTLAGLGLGFADTFLLNRILSGFTPRQFVNGPLKDFIYLK